jgi:hypothetical protein
LHSKNASKNVFQELEKALAIYGSGNNGGEMPVKDKSELVEALRIALEQISAYCRQQQVDLAKVEEDSRKHFLKAINQLLRTDRIKDDFLAQSNDVNRLYKAVMPDPITPDLAPRCQVIAELAKAIRAQKDPVNIAATGASVAPPEPPSGSPSKRCWMRDCRRNTRWIFSSRNAGHSSSTSWKSIRRRMRGFMREPSPKIVSYPDCAPSHRPCGRMIVKSVPLEVPVLLAAEVVTRMVPGWASS